MKDVHKSEMEDDFVMCEHTEEVGGEQSHPRIKTPPQKRRAVVRAQSAETHNSVSREHGLEESDARRDGGAELRPKCRQLAAMGFAHVRLEGQ